jgi:branched-subunit amino acid aminotransferase/4-amino-4-deoxychorismate lyase
LEQAGALQLRASEVRLSWEDLRKADEAFMTNAVVGIVPLAVIQHGRGQVRFAERGTARRLRSALEML